VPDLTSGFLVVKRFEALYGAFARETKFDSAIYALPVFGTTSERLSVRYRGLDRDALSPARKGTLAEMRLGELNGDRIDGTEDYEEALDVLGWANEEMPGVYEVVWTRIAERSSTTNAPIRRVKRR